MNVTCAKCRGALAILVIGLATPAPAADVEPYLPNDTEIVARINIRQLLDSPLVKRLALEHFKNALKSRGDVDAVFQQLGLDPFADLSTFTVAGPAGDDPNRGVVIVHGKFDVAKFKARAEAAVGEGAPLKMAKSGEHIVYELTVPEGPAKNIYVAIPDATTIVASPRRETLDDALDKHAGKKKTELNADLRARIARQPSSETAWIIALSQGLGKSVVGTDLTAKEFLDKSITVSSSVTVMNNVDLGATIDAKNPQDAAVLQKKLSDLIDQGKGVLQAFAQSNKELAPLMDLANSLKVTADDKTVSLKGTIPQSVIEKAIKR